MTALLLRRWPGCLLACCLIVGLHGASLRADEQKPVTREQKETLKERDRLEAQTRQFEAQGKLADAVAAAEKVLAIQRELFGLVHEDVAGSLEWLTRLYVSLERFPAARKSAGEYLQIRTKLYGKDHWRVADARLDLENVELLAKLPSVQRRELSAANAWNLQALGQYRKGNYKAGADCAKKALAIRQRVLGAEHRDTAKSLYALGVLLRSQGDYAGAKANYEQALAIRKKVLGAEHPDTAKSLNSLGILHWSQGDYPAAKPYYEQTLAICKKVLGAEHADTATAMNNLGNLLQADADYAAAKPYLEQALAIRKKVLGAEHADTAMVMNNLGNLLQAEGDYAAAKPYLEQALAVYQKTLGAEHPDTARSLNNLGVLLLEQGDYATAKPYLEQALAVYRKTLGAEHPDSARSLNNLGGLLREQGDYAAAKPYYERALAIRKKVLGAEHPDTAISLQTLGLLLGAQGDYAAAKPYYEHALAINTKVLGAEHPATATSLHFLGYLLQEKGDYAAAKPYCEQALAIRKKVLGAEHPDTARSLNNLGALLWSQEDYTAAKPYYEQALAIYKKVLGAEHPDTARSLNNLGLLHWSQGDYAAAKTYYDQALAIYKKVLGPEHFDTAGLLNNLGFLLQEQGDYTAAKPYFEQGLAVAFHNLELASAAQAERQQHAMSRQLRYHLDGYLSFAGKGKVPAGASYQAVLAWKGAVLSRQRRQRLLRGEPQLAVLTGELRSVSGRLATLAFTVPDPKKRAAWLRQLAELTEQKEKLEGELARRSRAFRKVTKPVTPADLQKLLPEGTVLVDFLDYEHFLPSKEKGSKTQWERRLTAFVVRPDRPLVRLDLGPAAPISRAIDEWRLTLKRRVPLTGNKDDPALVLRRLLWQPLEQALEGAKVVLVSPDGALCRLPLGALPGKDTGKYLMEETAITYVAVPQLLAEVLEPGRKGKPLVPSLLLAGEVDYDAAPGKEKLQVAATAAAPRQVRSGTLLHWARLEGTGGEVLRIRDFFERSFRGAKVTLLRDEEASEEAVAAAAPRHRYLHLATHGFFAPAELKSALATDATDGARPQMTADGPFGRHGVSGYHPGLLSGVVLAGANRQPEPGKTDGILTALEVAELDLSAVELAVLSACETGLGEVAGGEGLLGLQRAFQTAGARTVVASLWHVDDRFTRLLMERFYENLWRKKLGKQEALRQAQLWLLREGGSRGLDLLPEVQGGRLPPFYWAAFVLSGDWR